AQIAGIFQIFNFRRIAPELLVVGADGPRILNSAMNHFLFAVPLDLKRDRGNNDSCENYYQRHRQKQRQHDVATLSVSFWRTNTHRKRSPLGQRDVLRWTAVYQILNFNRRGRYANNLVSPVHDLSLAS